MTFRRIIFDDHLRTPDKVGFIHPGRSDHDDLGDAATLGVIQLVPDAPCTVAAAGKAIDRRDPFVMTDSFECHLYLRAFWSVVARGVKYLALIPIRRA